MELTKTLSYFSDNLKFDCDNQKVFRFENGYGASVICKVGISYGWQSGLWELAVLDKDDRITYDTPITDDVLGWLSDEDVLEILKEIADLPRKEE